MNREPLIMVCTCEMAGRVRGKGFPLKDLPERLSKGVGWVPTNSMISCFGIIGDTPFGATGDLILVPGHHRGSDIRWGRRMVCMMRVSGVGIRQRRRQAGDDQQSHDSDQAQDHAASIPHWGRPIQATSTAPAPFHSPACAGVPHLAPRKSVPKKGVPWSAKHASPRDAPK